MSARQAILKKLLASRNVAVERVADRVLASAPAGEQRELAELLLQRNRRGGWVALIRAFNYLDENVRREMVARPRELFGPLAETMQDSDGPSRENVITIVRECADAKLTYLLVEALIDSRQAVRELAGRALLEAVRKHMNSCCEGDQAEQMEKAVEHGLRTFKTHRQTAAVTAALALERKQDGHTWACFGDSYDEATRAATLVLRNPRDAMLARGAILALGSSLKPAAMAGLASAVDPEVLQALVEEAYRLMDPVLAETAATIGQAKFVTAFKKGGGRGLVTEETWAGWLRMIEKVGIPAVQKAAMFQAMLQLSPVGADGVAWRLAIVQGAARACAGEAGELLVRLADDPDERVARIAARTIMGRRTAMVGAGSDYRGLAPRLANSRHESVKKIARGISVGVPRISVMAIGNGALGGARPAAGAGPTPEAGNSFEKIWAHYEQMPPAVRHAQTRAAAGDAAFTEELRGKLASAQVSDTAQALRMLASLENVAAFRAQIIALCGHADARVAAIAVKLAGRLEDPRLKDLLEHAAHHSDARVRANAIESMELLRIADRSQQVLAMLNSRHNRERANAIKALSRFNFETARECLMKMLVDQNPIHRMSALWVVQELQLLEMVRQVSAMARRDPNVRVRKRASMLLDTLATHVAAGA
ncbi:MAG TPA: HEAT repeat domain-containing protein [Phycisphaerae bacterium]|nr:HEAT repeat domain-containing protein [Phycisphaerae bacterium]